jgi:hypothetical protein
LLASAIVLWLAAIFVAAMPTTAVAAVRIKDDYGGNIGIYWSR